MIIERHLDRSDQDSTGHLFGPSLWMMQQLRAVPDLWDDYTRREEYALGAHDRIGRFPFSSSRHRNIEYPAGSAYLLSQGLEPAYPEGHPFTICLNHDIDRVFQTVSDKGILMARWLRRDSGVTDWRSFISLNPKRPFCNFKTIAAIEQEYDATSTFFFLATDSGKPEHSYTIEDLGSEIGEIIDMGAEVALHGGCTSYRSPVEIEKAKGRLERVTNRRVLGYRNHFLRFSVPDSWKYLAQAGFLYDSTQGYADTMGFKGGLCHPFTPYDPAGDGFISILEIPLTIMDTTWFHHLRLSPEEAWLRIKTIVDIVEDNRGVATLLWHNDSFIGEPATLYRRILEYASERDAWLTNSLELAQWWTRQSPPV